MKKRMRSPYPGTPESRSIVFRVEEDERPTLETLNQPTEEGRRGMSA
jgi:hypothetical protein